MILFHVSFTDYVIGQTYVAPNPNGYHLRSVEHGDGWINLVLDQYKPEIRPSRIASFYACDKVGFCKAFIGAKKIEGRSPIYYKVEMDCQIGFPMVLIDTIKNIGENSTELRACIDEYWSPSNEWKYLEYLSPNMTILEVLQEPDNIMVSGGNMNYGLDLAKAKRDFNR